MFDCEFSELLTVTVQLAVAFAALLVEHEHLVALYEHGLNLSYYLCTLYHGSTYFNFAVCVEQQHFLKFNSLTGFGLRHVVHEELFAFFGLELLTVNLNDCVHCCFDCV